MTDLGEVSVQTLVERISEPLQIEIVAGVPGQHRVVRSSRIQKPGLALVGHLVSVHPDRVQVLGRTELSFLETLSIEAQKQSVDRLLALELACILITKNHEIPKAILDGCHRTNTVLLRTPKASSECIRKVLTYLDDLLTPRTSVHGVLVDVDGVGVLLTGNSGIGKSECALDLVLRGHRLVADDVVDIRRRGDDLVGQAADMIRNLIEIRGLGILNVSELYGVAATRDHKRIELHIELEDWRSDRVYDRIGLESPQKNILGLEVESALLPVRPGRNIAAIVEVAARNSLLKTRGHHAALDLKRRMESDLEKHTSVSTRDLYVAVAEPDQATADLRSAARLTDVTDHIEDEVE
jgi:HPr kinase/phosphorylase